MSARSRLPRAALLAAGTAAAAAGAAYGAQRFAASRLRRRPARDEPRALESIIERTHRVASHDGGTIHVVDAGDGPPIVLLHGVTLSVRTWYRQLESLPAQGFRVLAFDHRGHGASELGGTGHSVENLALDVVSVLEGLDLRGAVLVGHSMGGVAVQAFVSTFPDVVAERVAGIVLLSTLARAPMGSQSTRVKHAIERVTRRFPDTKRLWASPNLGLLAARIGFGRDPDPAHVELVRQMMLECGSDTRRDAPAALVGLDLVAGLRGVAVPTLVVGGTADVLTPPAESRRLARVVPGARLHLFAGGGHMLMLERSDELDRLVSDFAREVARGATGAPRAPADPTTPAEASAAPG